MIKYWLFFSTPEGRTFSHHHVIVPPNQSCMLSELKIPTGKGAVELFSSQGTYSLMSPWFIRKGTFRLPLSWRDLCMRMLTGWSEGPVKEKEEGGGGFYHKHGDQSAKIALHTKGSSTDLHFTRGLYFGSLAPFSSQLLHHLSVLIRLFHSYASAAKFPAASLSEWLN